MEDAKFAVRTIPDVDLLIVSGGFHVLALMDSTAEITRKRVQFLENHAFNGLIPKPSLPAAKAGFVHDRISRKFNRRRVVCGVKS